MVDLVEKYGISGYYYIYPSSMKGIMLHHADHSGRANAERIWNPILAKMGSYPNMTKAKLEISEFNSYKAYFDARFGPIDQGKQPPKTMPWETHSRRSMLEPRHGPGMEMTEPVPSAIANLDSRLLGAEHFKHPNLTAYFKAASPWVLGANQSVVQGHLVGGGKVFHPDDDTSVLPAWRQAYSHVIGYKVPGKASLDSLRVLAPESGAYANEVRQVSMAKQNTNNEIRRTHSRKIGSNHSGDQITINSLKLSPNMTLI
jgi:hypothetical protein